MSDLFEREEKVLEEALDYAEKAESDLENLPIKYGELAREYARLLRQLRRMTKLTDRTTDQLNIDRLELLDKVNYDALTGIYNRRYLESRLPEIIEELSKTKAPLSVLMLDVDYFKKYNDHYGHSAGDKCLRTVARAVAKRVGRKDDFVARYGGEEFTVVLPNTDRDGACCISECILEIIQNLAVPHVDSAVAEYITISIGATTASVSSGLTPLQLFEKADVALYQAKQGGRNRYVYLAHVEE